MNDCIRDAYSALRSVTPLPNGLDCGKLCGARCCQGGDDDGMVLFWGEERLFAHDPRFTIRTNGDRKLLICSGVCNRRTRPLACRMYPFYPVPQETDRVLSIRVVYDLRGLSTCPLVREHCKPDPRFVQAVRKAGLLLSRDPRNLRILQDTADLLHEMISFTELLHEDIP